MDLKEWKKPVGTHFNPLEYDTVRFFLDEGRMPTTADFGPEHCSTKQIRELYLLLHHLNTCEECTIDIEGVTPVSVMKPTYKLPKGGPPTMGSGMILGET